MQISITARGIDQFQSKFTAYEKKQSSIISSFTTVKTKTRNASGGVGNMQGALNSISARLKREETKKTAAQTIRKKADDFVGHARQTDRLVADKVKQASDAFYKKYPRLKPASDDKPWYEQIWDQLCKGVDAIKEGLKNLWDSAVEFYNKHKDLIHLIAKILISVVIVVGAVVGIIATCGSGLAVLGPLLMAFGLSVSTATTISTIIVVATAVSTGLAALMDVIDLWLEIDHPVFNFFQMTFSIISFLGNLTVGVGKTFNLLNNIDANLGVKIRKMAKIDMKKAMEMSVPDGTTNPWYLRNLAEGSEWIKFTVTDNIKYGFKYGSDPDGLKYLIKWHSLDHGALKKYGPRGGGSGWTAQLYFKETTVKEFLTTGLNWVIKPNEFTHIPIPSLPPEGLFDLSGWMKNNWSEIIKTWVLPFRR